MYAGVIVEEAPVAELFATPLHPYTRGLLASIPRGRGQKRSREPLLAIPGLVPNLLRLPSGCRFRDRCPLAMSRCAEAEPPLGDLGNRRVRCWLHEAPRPRPPARTDRTDSAERTPA
jgi:oligopeptide/dipeptide ABC transporter ATP-binding protein